ncbi:hypothetical protein LMG28138_01232 [Pararobbsia alpina]|uniref:DUF2059 domain-containing protein n=2 Tax=Pararobbsia alpina TaxID=621374 RepID=A0A6S7AY81_9BURK|nr:hypothetical protein LMG28138_01232 [Pararobbsia alpina]
MQKYFKLLPIALFVPTLVFAQALQGQNAPATGAQAPQAPAAPARIDIDAAKKAAIKDLFAAIEVEKLEAAMANSAQMRAKEMVPEILQEALVENQSMTVDQKRAVVPQLQQSSIPKLVESAGTVFATPQFKADQTDSLYQAYARYYSTQEIKDLTTFYKSSTGQKFLHAQDLVGRDVVNGLLDKYMPQSVNATRSMADKEVANVKAPAAGAAPAAPQK